MRVLLVGGNGFIGSPLVRELVGAGYEVAVFHRHLDALSEPNSVHQIIGDRNRLSSYLHDIREFRPDIIIDLILSSGEQARELMSLARQVVPRVIALSSMDVYRAWGVLYGIEEGPLEPLPLTEDSPLRRTRRLYSAEAIQGMQAVFSWVNEAYDKIAVEEVIMGDAEVSGTILRLPMVYGPGDPLKRFFPLWKRIFDGRSSMILFADMAAWRAPRGYVDNVAHGIALALSDRAIGRVYHLCQEPCLTEFEWHKKIAEQANWTGKLVVLAKEHTPKHLVIPGNFAQHIVASSERIRKELGYGELVPCHEAIRRTLAWHERNPKKTPNLWRFDYEAEDLALVHVN